MLLPCCLETKHSTALPQLTRLPTRIYGDLGQRLSLLNLTLQEDFDHRLDTIKFNCKTVQVMELLMSSAVILQKGIRI